MVVFAILDRSDTKPYPSHMWHSEPSSNIPLLTLPSVQQGQGNNPLPVVMIGITVLKSVLSFGFSFLNALICATVMGAICFAMFFLIFSYIWNDLLPYTHAILLAVDKYGIQDLTYC